MPRRFSLKSECEKAVNTLKSFLDNGLGQNQRIPPDVLTQAQGLAMFTIYTNLIRGSNGFGSVVVKLNNELWSAPSAILIGRFVPSLQVYSKTMNFLLVLNTKEAVDEFRLGKNILIRESSTMHHGPTINPSNGLASMDTMAPPPDFYIYYKMKGFSFEKNLDFNKGRYVYLIREWSAMNMNLYGRPITAAELLSSIIPIYNHSVSLLNDALRFATQSYSVVGAVEETVSSVQEQRASMFTTIAIKYEEDASETLSTPEKTISQSP